MRPWRVYPRHKLDLRAGDLAYALAASALARAPAEIEQAIEAEAGANTLVCFSVRSAFELLLDALVLRPGDEVLVSAVTHPDMPRIIERHGLVAVPVDLDVSTLAPRIDAIERALTPRTRVVVVAHLFGGRADLRPIAEIARQHGLLLVEDCAQSFAGDFGDSHAAISLFSFGSIKTCTALGGAIACVRGPELLMRMRALQEDWPRQRRAQYVARVLRFAGLLLLGVPSLYGLFVRAGGLFGADVETLVNKSVRALKPPSGDVDAAFSHWARRRPSAPSLALLRHRLRTFDAARLRARAARGEALVAALPLHLVHPGDAALERTHWVFPVVTADVSTFVERLRASGFDATRATTSIDVVRAPAGRDEPETARWLIDNVVFLPAYPELPARDFRRLEQTLAQGGAEDVTAVATAEMLE